MVANPIRQIHEARTKNWPTAEATVDSCSWVDGHDNLGNQTGHYDVTFVYKAGTSDEVHRGTFCYPGSKSIVPYCWGETVPIQYNPKKPERYNFSGTDSSYEKLETILVLVLFALTAGYVLYTF
ncbi:MAG TPA: DUF3592 domain-containing protein [Acidobacteriaceae bacterium]|jgi:hypothetical protein